MLHHTQAVGRGFRKPLNKQPLVVCDLPFLSYQCGEDKAVEAAGTLIKNSCATGVKVEGAEPEVIAVIERLIRMGIPVMGHLGSPIYIGAVSIGSIIISYILFSFGFFKSITTGLTSQYSGRNNDRLFVNASGRLVLNQIINKLTEDTFY